MDASIPEVLVLLNAAIANGYFEFPNGKVNLNHVHFVAAGNTVGSGAATENTKEDGIKNLQFQLNRRSRRHEYAGVKTHSTHDSNEH